MKDIRIEKLARVLVHYSIAAKRREVITVDATTAATPLVEAVYEQLLLAGAFPVVRLAPPFLQEIFFRHGQPMHFDTVNPFVKATLQAIQGSIHILSSANTKALSSCDPKRQVRFAKTMGPVREKMSKKKWSLTLFPSAAYAQDAEMSLREFEDFVFSATFADDPNPVACWKALERKQAQMIRQLRGAKQVRIVGPETDLAFSVAGRTFINSSGHHNMPSGEI
ncbi:MAG: aminopeptidase, partial [Lentisphaerota bacterium]